MTLSWSPHGSLARQADVAFAAPIIFVHAGTRVAAAPRPEEPSWPAGRAYRRRRLLLHADTSAPRACGASGRPRRAVLRSPRRHRPRRPAEAARTSRAGD